MKRLIPLLVLAIAVTAAPAAMANHCTRCNPIVEDCVHISNFGFEICEFDPFTFTCYTELPCGSHVVAEPEPLAAEFTVASVERIDEPKTPASETRIAALETPQPAAVR